MPGRAKIERDILERCPREMSERKEEDKGPRTKGKGFNPQEGSPRLSGWLWISLSLQRAGWSGKQGREGTQSLTDLLLSPLNSQSAEPSVQVKAVERTGCPKQPINSRVKTKCLLLSLMEAI